MTDKPQDEDRLDRDRGRSTEAHWRVAEAGSEDEPTQKTPKGLETPVRKRKNVIDALRKLVQPAKKP